MNENTSTAGDTDHREIVWGVDRYRRTGRFRPKFVRSRPKIVNPPTELPQQSSARNKWNRGLLVAAGLFATDVVTGELVGRLVDAALGFSADAVKPESASLPVLVVSWRLDLRRPPGAPPHRISGSPEPAACLAARERVSAPPKLGASHPV